MGKGKNSEKHFSRMIGFRLYIQIMQEIPICTRRCVESVKGFGKGTALIFDPHYFCQEHQVTLRNHEVPRVRAVADPDVGEMWVSKQCFQDFDILLFPPAAVMAKEQVLKFIAIAWGYL